MYHSFLHRLRAPLALAVGLAVLSAACWGCGTVMSRALLAHLAPLTLLVVQLGASVTVLALALTAQRHGRRFTWDDLRAGMPGLFEPGLAYLLGVIGLSLTSASRASLLSATEPLFVIGLAWAVLREQMHWRVVSLVGVAVLGVGLVSATGAEALAAGTLQGDVLVLLGTAAAALYVVLTRRLLRDRAPLPLTLAQQLVGLVGVVAVWLGAVVAQHPVAALPAVGLVTLLGAALSGVVQYALAFWLYLHALQRLPATIAASFLTLTPLFGVAGAAMVLGERLTLIQWLGALCILGPITVLVFAKPAGDGRDDGA